MSWRRIRAIARKEIFHIGRDKFTLALALILPVVVVSIFGFAIEFNLNEIPIVYLDSDRTSSSRALVETFGSSGFFRTSPTASAADGMQRLESERNRAFLVIPPFFEKNLLSGRQAEVQVLVDAADSSSASSVMAYLGQIRARAEARILERDSEPPLSLRTRFLFNPELSSRWFVVPGLVVVVMSILSILLTALTVAKEWESGSMELLLSTPVRPIELILGKILPYAGLGLAGVAIVYIMARLVFGIPFLGSHLVFLFGCVLFLVTYLAQGLLISIVARRQMVAMQFAMISGLLPSMLLSGFIFPVESMPPFFRYFTMIFPARWFMVISRDSFLQGSSLWDLRLPFFFLAGIGSLLILAATKRFKRDLEP